MGCFVLNMCLFSTFGDFKEHQILDVQRFLICGLLNMDY